MRTRVVLAAAVLASLLGGAPAPACAASAALVAALERGLRPVEKAVLAAVLAERARSAEFDADMRLAQADPGALPYVTAKWRMRLAGHAQAFRNLPNPDLEGTYRSYPEMLRPETQTYLARRLRDLQERSAADPEARRANETLRGYLRDVQDDLNDDQKLNWMGRRIVSGIMDRYRSELVEMLGYAETRVALRDGPAATAELARRHEARASAAREAQERRRAAERRAAAERSAAEERASREAAARRAAERQAAPEPAAPVASTPATAPAEPAESAPAPAAPATPSPAPAGGAAAAPEQRGGALEQAQAAEQSAREGRPGEVFDGGASAGPAEPAPVGVPEGGSEPSGLAPASGAPVPGETGAPSGAEPPALSAQDELLASIAGPGQGGSGTAGRVQRIARYGGAAAGALLGLLVAGPLGGLLGGLLGFLGGGKAVSLLLGR